MKRILVAAVAFLTALSICLFIWWCSGFNFDQRGMMVSVNAIITIWLSITAGYLGFVLGG
ncbi:MAG TPA: hypothetical protein VIY48_03065 [Candidatus Paceibacterota bacterium]